MSLYLIYSGRERAKAETVAHSLVGEGYSVALAPLGLEVGTEAWKTQVLKDLKTVGAVLLLMTRESVIDASVAWRAEVALGSEPRPRFIPILLDEHESMPPATEWVLPRRVMAFNWIRLQSEEDMKRLLQIISSVIPRDRLRVKCFVSYSREDDSLASQLRAELIRSGIAAWRDIDDIPAGAAWDEAIQNAIASSTHVLLIVTSHSNKSSNVADEIGLARDKGKTIIPLLFETVDLPFRVRRAQAVDFTGDFKEATRALTIQLGSLTPPSF